MAKNSKGVLYLIILLIVLVLCLGGYLVYDKILEPSNNTTTTTTTTTKPSNSSYYVEIGSVCPSTGDCTKNLDDLLLGDKSYKIAIMVKNSDDCYNIESESACGYAKLNDKKIDFSSSEYLDLIAVMNNKFLLLGTSGPANDMYQITLYDINLNQVKIFNTQIPGFEYVNDKKFIWTECASEDNPDPNSDLAHPQKLTTYELNFANESYSQNEVSVEHNTFCSAAVE